MREQYLRQAASLRRSGHEELAVQFKNLFKLRAPYVESPNFNIQMPHLSAHRRNNRFRRVLKLSRIRSCGHCRSDCCLLRDEPGEKVLRRSKKMARNGSRRTGPSLNQIGETYLLFVSNPPCGFLQLDLGPIARWLELLAL